MRKKAFTLVEILVSSLIFVIVVSVGVSSFALIRRSNEKADDMRLSDQCVRQIRDYVSERVRETAKDYDGAKIKAIIASGNTFSLAEYEKTDFASRYPNGVAGVALFKANNAFEAIYKRDGVYKKGDYTVSGSGALINFSSNDINVASSDCAAYVSAPAAASADLDGYQFTSPFRVYYLEHQPDYDGTIKDKIYKVEIDDIIFRANKNGQEGVETPETSYTNHTFSKLSVDATNSARKLW